MLDKRTNASISELAKALASCESFAISGHVNPDGDCLGSALALAHALRGLGKSATVLLVEDTPIEPGLAFLPGLDKALPAERYTDSPDAFVYVDVSVSERIGKSAEVLKRAKHVFAIDHHAGTEDVAELIHVDPAAASCTLLVWELVKELGVPITPEIALCAYAGLMTDTGRFQFQNTDARSFRAAAEMVEAGAQPSYAAREFFQNRNLASLKLEQRMVDRIELLHEGMCAFSYLTLGDFAACEAQNSDAEELIDTLRSIRGARVACLLKERDGFVRGSFRAKDDDTDVADLARALGGGGHKAAAGFTLHMSLPDAIEATKAQIARLA